MIVDCCFNLHSLAISRFGHLFKSNSHLIPAVNCLNKSYAHVLNVMLLFTFIDLEACLLNNNINPCSITYRSNF